MSSPFYKHVELLLLVCSEGMLGANARMKHALRCRIAFHRARDGFLRRRIVEILNFLIIIGVPMDENADADEEIVSCL